MILSSRSFPQLNATFEEYSNLCKYSMEQSIKREMSGDLEKGMLTIGMYVYYKYKMVWKRYSILSKYSFIIISTAVVHQQHHLDISIARLPCTAILHETGNFRNILKASVFKKK